MTCCNYEKKVSRRTGDSTKNKDSKMSLVLCLSHRYRNSMLLLACLPFFRIEVVIGGNTRNHSNEEEKKSNQMYVYSR